MSKLLFLQKSHLQLRFWISELNSLIDQIRILNDFLITLSPLLQPTELLSVEQIKEGLVVLRSNLDDLRNEIHIDKMKFAASLKSDGLVSPESEAHLKTLYHKVDAVQKKFTEIKKFVESLTG